jgi:predicted AlkP superfamily pyrophosphatase or phosphodiesterase
VALGIKSLERAFIYAPDAVGRSLFEEKHDWFSHVLPYAPIEVQLRSVFPPKTPVAFASMFTGVMPRVHGIKEYKKPILKCDTLFDALARAHRKVAIIAVKESSIDLIFKGRKVDYFTEDYDPEVKDRALELLKEDKHDLILAYNQEYDDVMHREGTRSYVALGALRNHLRTFQELSEAVNKCWKGHDRAIIFTPDHGAHQETKEGKGVHGDDIPEDMEVVHLYGFKKGRS